MSGQGEVIIEENNPNNGDTTIFLWNFETSRHELKVEHQMALLDDVIPTIMDPISPPNVQIIGMASRRGGTGFNQELSERRAQEVFNFLVSGGVPRGRLRRFNPPRGVGESLSNRLNENDNSDLERAVIIIITQNPLPPIRLPRPRRPNERERFQPSGKPMSNFFAIAMKGGIQGNIIGPISIQFSIFIIWDPLNMVASKYDFLGRGFGGGFPSIPLVPGSASLTSPWNHFTTNQLFAVDEFAGQAEFLSVGVGPSSGARLQMQPNKSPFPPIEVRNFRTGDNIGLPSIIDASGHQGPMFLNGGIVPFIGIP